MKIFAAMMRLPKAALGGIGAAAVGTTVLATTMIGGGGDASAALRVLTGTVQVQVQADDAFRPAKNGEIVTPVSTVRTGSNGRAQLTFFDGSITRLNYDTTFSLRELSGAVGGDRKILSNQTSGRTFNRVKKLTGSGSRVEVKTPNATASVRGTDFEVFVPGNGDSIVKVFPDNEPGNSQVVFTSNEGQQQTVNEGEKSTALSNGDVTEPEALTQEDFGEWKQFNDCLDGQATCEGQPDEDSALLTQATATPVETARVLPRVFAAAATDAPVITEAPIEPEQPTEEPEPTPEPLLPDPTEEPQAETPEPTEEPQQAGELSGRVVDENTKAGVEGAKVTATNTNDPSDTHATTTDENGEYTFTGLTPGEEYEVTVENGNYDSGRQTATVEPDSPNTLDFGLNPVPGSVRVSVVDMVDGTPITDAVVDLDGQTQMTGADGSATFGSVAASRAYDVRASKDEYVANNSTVTVDPGESESLSIPLRLDDDIAGFVREAGTGTPIAGVTVEVEGSDSQGVTAPDGSYVLTGLAPRETPYDVTASHGHYKPKTLPAVVEPIVTTELSFDLEKTVTDLKKGIVDVTVKDEVGVLISGANVSLTDAGGQAMPAPTSTSAGLYRFADLTQGDYTAAVEHVDYTTGDSEPVTVTPGDTSEVGLTLSDLKKGIVDVTVKDEAGALISGADVTLNDAGGQAMPAPTSTSAGLYRFADLTQGDYTAAVEHEDYTTGDSEPVAVTPGDTSEVGLTVSDLKKGTVDVTVKDEDGALISGADVTLTDAEGQEVAGQTSPSAGLYRFADLTQGDYTAAVEHVDYTTGDSEPVAVTPGDTSEVGLTLSDLKKGIVDVTVKDEAGALISGADVTLNDAGGQAMPAPTSTSAGLYRFADLTQGDYTAAVEHEDYTTGDSEPVAVTPGDTSEVGLTVSDLKKGTVDVTVKDEDGALISGADVTLTDAEGQEVAGQTSPSAGLYRFADLTQGDYTAAVEHVDYTTGDSEPVAVTPGDTSEVGLTLSDLKKGIVDVTVKDEAGALISGADVTLNDAGGQAMPAPTSTSAGLYRFADLTQGDYTAAVEHEDYTTGDSEPVAVTPGDTSEVGLTVSDLKKGTVDVTVKDEDGALISGADVTLTDAEGQEVAGQTSPSAGLYRFADLTQGDYTAAVEHEDYTTGDSESVTVTPGDTSEVGLTVSDLKKGTVEVTVTSDYTDGPIDGATVDLRMSTTPPGPVLTDETDSAGKAVFTAVPHGTYDIQASAASHVSNNTTVTVTPGDDHRASLVLLPQDGSVKGIITDDATGAKLTNATATLLSTSLSDSTNVDGEYSIEPVAPKAYTLRVTAPDYGAKDLSVDVQPGPATTTKDVALTRHKGSVSGVVRNAGNGQVLAGAIVTLNGQDATSSATGTYSFGDVPVGTYSMTARKSGFSTSTQSSVVVQANQTTTVNFSLSESLGENELRIVLQWGTSPPDLDSHLWLPSSHRYQVYYNRKGRSTACPYATLDVDDTNGEGPETIKVSRAFAGSYRYAAYRYNSGNIHGSNARVTVYDEDGQLAEFTVPTGTGGWWHPFDASFNLETSQWELNAVAPETAISTSSPQPYSDNASCN